MMDTTVLIAGGDKRQIYVARLLAADYKVYAIGLEDSFGDVININSLCELSVKPDIIIFPILSSVDNEHVNMPLSDITLRIEDVLEYAKHSAVVLAGKPCATLCELCGRKNLKLIDYFEREELAVLNAVPTAFVFLHVPCGFEPVKKAFLTLSPHDDYL